MEAFFIALAAVTIAEFGDKSQLVTVYLSARYQRPLAVFAGLALASLVSHGLAVLLGAGLSRIVPDSVLHWLVGLSFLAMAAWTLRSEEVGDHDEVAPFTGRGLGPFLVTFLVFFALEIGDKTQLTSMALAARFDSAWMVLTGAAAGMMIANLPAVWVGHRFASRIPFAMMRRVSAALFALIGIGMIVYAVFNG